MASRRANGVGLGPMGGRVAEWVPELDARRLRHRIAPIQLAASASATGGDPSHPWPTQGWLTASAPSTTPEATQPLRTVSAP